MKLIDISHIYHNNVDFSYELTVGEIARRILQRQDYRIALLAQPVTEWHLVVHAFIQRVLRSYVPDESQRYIPYVVKRIDELLSEEKRNG